jgi:membrane carboxypeptidase/penicillin-binding protein PbpC
LSLQVICAPQQDRIDWLIDDAPIGTTAANEALPWPLAVGRHRVTARDSHGHSAETSIVVR